jgi:putative SOS response-associated peptidase YedK
MCGRINLFSNMALIVAQLRAELLAEPLPKRYNIAPTNDVLVLRLNDHRRQLSYLRWGLIPSWAKDKSIYSSGINARAETIQTKPMFRAAFKSRRCLIVADGYYEWLAIGKTKYPKLYTVDDGRPFAIAGLWERWTEPTTQHTLESCAIITTTANSIAKEVHDRMPVILDERDYDEWLEPANQDVEHLLIPLDDDRLHSRWVDTSVNNVKNQGPACIADAAYPNPL